MEPSERTRVESEALGDFARVMTAAPQSRDRGFDGDQRPSARLKLDASNAKNGLGQLVLTVVKLLHELMERQAIRRIEAGSLSDQQIERLGMTLMRQAQEIERLRNEFGLEEDDLNLDLGPLGKLL
jgi:gas vesicle protein GvpK